MARVYFPLSSSVFLSAPWLVYNLQNHLIPPTTAVPRSGFTGGPVANSFGKTVTKDVQHNSQPSRGQQITPCQKPFTGSLNSHSIKHTKSHGLLSLAFCEGRAFLGGNLRDGAMYHRRITASFAIGNRKPESDFRDVCKMDGEVSTEKHPQILLFRKPLSSTRSVDAERI